MFCSGCGQPLAAGQTVCPQCGRPSAPPVPPVPNLDFQLANYSGRVRALSIVWFVYGGLSLAMGFAGLAFAGAMFHGNVPWAHGPWMHPPFDPGWFFPAMLRFGWAVVLVRSGLALLAGWGLMERAQWGRIVAIAAGILSLIRIPIGTALGIWTLVTLLGYRNTVLYDRL